MHSLTRTAFAIFLSTGGLFALAALESTLFFWFPFGVDAAVIILAVRHSRSAWEYPLAAAAGSLAGAMITFWMGRKIGESGLKRFISARRLKSTKAAIHEKGALTIPLFGLVPPPFPFTAFVLASGALSIDAVRFLGVLAAVRLVRFGVETLLAAHYGSSVLRWMNSDVVEDVVAAFIAIALVGSAISLVTLLRRR